MFLKLYMSSLLIILLLVSSCGQTGALYLPKQPTKQFTTNNDDA